MRKVLLSILGGSILFAMSCGDGNVVIQEDPAIQAAIDSATIVNYLADLGLEGDTVKTTDLGVHYVILDRGNEPLIDESDIVSFFYTGKLLNDTIFDTSLKSVADSIRMKVAEDSVGKEDVSEHLLILNSFPESRNYSPYTFGYSSTGWTLSTSNFISGYSDGIAASFNKMGEGGKALIVIPSARAYGARGSGAFIEPNTVIAFELFPSEVIKQ